MPEIAEANVHNESDATEIHSEEVENVSSGNVNEDNNDNFNSSEQILKRKPMNFRTEMLK